MRPDKISLSVSIVTYKTDPALLEAALLCSTSGALSAQVYVVDNSPDDSLRKTAEAHGAIYLFPGSNLGFGRGHNLALTQIGSSSNYHLLLNSDISFEPSVLEELCAFMDLNPAIGWVMPNVLYPDGSRQELCKRLPTPWDLFNRRFLRWPGASFSTAARDKFKCRDIDLSKIRKIPNLSGCFALVRTNVIQAIGGFDERFFLYLEDTDLVRRVGQVAHTIFYPHVDVYHVRGRGSYSNLKLLGHHVRSAIQYFCKWGWWIDNERTRSNRSVAFDECNFTSASLLPK